MRNYVIINGVNSLDIQGLAINNLPPITKPMIRTQREEIDGRDGDIVTELGYSAYDKQMEIGLYGNFDIDAIIKYFTGEGTIVFSNEEDKYYNFKILDQIDYEKLLKFKTATITFHCQPFKYPVEETPIEGEAITITGSGSNITLENTVVAPMEMKVKGNTIQDGTPTPDSPIPVQVVSGDNTINVVGINVWDEQWELGKLEANNSLSTFGQKVSSTTQIRAVNYIKVLPNTTYYCYRGGSTGAILVIAYDKDKSAIASWNYKNATNTTFTTPANAEYILWYANAEYGTTYGNNICINVSNTSINGTYYPYTSNSYEIDLPVKNLVNSVETHNGINGSTGVITTENAYLGFNDYIDCKPNTTYTISFEHDNPSGTLYIGYKNQSGTYIERVSNGTSRTFTTPNNAYYLIAYSYYAQGFSTIGGWVQLEEGTKANHYTPYGTTPIEMNAISTYKDTFIKNSGKNLCNAVNQNVYLNQAVTQCGIASDNSGLYIPVSGGYYTVSTLSTQTRYRVACSSTTPPTIGSGTAYNGVNKDGTNNTITIDTTGYDYLIVNATDLSAIQIEKGNTATSYEPYGTGWYLKKEIGKVVLNGSEDWSYKATSTSGIVRMTTTILNGIAKGSASGGEVSKGYCDYYTLKSPDGTYLQNTGLSITSFGNIEIYDTNYNTTSSVSPYQTWLGTNNVELLYLLQTPTYETITDTTLIGQLEALKKSYEGQTNISQVNNDLPFELDASVTFLTPMEINNIGNIYAKPILTIEGSGNIGVVLNDIQILDIDLSNNGKITIDVPKLEAYDPDDDSLLNRLVTGDYMKLLINEGDNKITFTGEVSGATLTNYIRWI